MSIAYTPRTETIVIPQGDDEERLRQLRAYRDSLKPDKKRAPVLLTDDPDAEYREAEQAVRDFAKEVEERGITVVMRSLGRKTWRELIAEHPPREGNDSDKLIGVNADSFGRAIVVACMASPVFDNDADRDEFLDEITEADYGRIERTAWDLNTGRSSDPKADLASKLTST